jgi:hypothetical protein
MNIQIARNLLQGCCLSTVRDSKRSPSIRLKKGEEDNLINSPPFRKGAGGSRQFLNGFLNMRCAFISFVQNFAERWVSVNNRR